MYWKDEIGKAGIWSPDLFKEIHIQIRPKSKSYNGLFSRKYLLKRGRRVLTDRIFIYRNSEEFDPNFLDSVLVHEMIHQYICQTGQKDTSTHGKLFKSYMQRINRAFIGQLSINLRDHNPSVPLSGPGNTLHRLVLSWTDKYCYCCVINPAKLPEFDKLLRNYKKRGTVKDYHWAQSNDVLFDRYVRCTKTLHGIKKPIGEMRNFCLEHNIIKAPL